MLVNIDVNSPLPLYRQIVEDLKIAISEGYVKAGEKLPSILSEMRALNFCSTRVQGIGITA
jgi:DNA-binding transcriptional regulator YhcF (GntR family)